MLVEYTIGDDGCHYEMTTKWGKSNPEYIVEDCAEDFYHNRDGWDSSWPVDITVYINRESIGTFEVECDFEPTFSATKI